MKTMPHTASSVTPVIAIHGGAGTLTRSHISPEQERAYHAALQEVLCAGQAVLARGGSALDAVCVAVQALEDCPLFNAGHGAVFTSAETHELDAAVMEGATLRAGAVACVSRIKRPLRAARAVMEASEHVLLAGAGAEAFAAGRSLRWWLQPADDPARVIGSVHLSSLVRGAFQSCNLGYALDAGCQGQGLMHEALTAVLDEAFSPRVRLHRIQAAVRPENRRSRATLLALGFAPEGLSRRYLFIDGAWRDHEVFALLNPGWPEREAP